MINEQNAVVILEPHARNLILALENTINLYNDLPELYKIAFDDTTQAGCIHNLFFHSIQSDFGNEFKNFKVRPVSNKKVYLLLDNPNNSSEIVVFKFKKLTRDFSSSNIQTFEVKDFCSHQLAFKGFTTTSSIILGYLPNETFTSATLYALSPKGSRNFNWLINLTNKYKSEVIDNDVQRQQKTQDTQIVKAKIQAINKFTNRRE